MGALTVHVERLADIAFAEPERDAAGGIAAPALRIRDEAARGISFRYSDNEPRIIADLDSTSRPASASG